MNGTQRPATGRTGEGKHMAALDEVQLREGVDRETVETVQSMAGTYKHGWETEIEMEFAPRG
jgi:Fe-S cluster assembly protein SufB